MKKKEIVTELFVAFDGQEFDNENDCLAYEKKLNANADRSIKLKSGKVINKDDVLEFFNIAVKDCKTCPFKVECDKTYSFTRAKSTSTLTVCSALRGPEDYGW